MENKGETVPIELQIEIMLRMPLKTLLKCICVSKKWASIIRGKQFKDLYLLRSMTRPRAFFGFFPIRNESLERDVLFHSVYQEEKPLLSTGQQHLSFPTKPAYYTTQPVRGLVCFQVGPETVICNPGTKKFLSLPEIQACKKAVVRRPFLGYEEHTDVFKVLCMTKMELFGPGNFHVLTMGSGEESWRPIICKYQHSPITEGLCKAGVLYYGAFSKTYKFMVMKFNVGSEEFSAFELPEIRTSRLWNLVKYNGEIAAVDKSSNSLNAGEMEIWVLNEDAGQWLRLRFVIPRWKETVGTLLSFKGTIGTGELVFATDLLIGTQFFVMCYDAVTKNVRRFDIEGMAGCQGGWAQTFLDHVDSLSLV